MNGILGKHQRNRELRILEIDKSLNSEEHIYTFK